MLLNTTVVIIILHLHDAQITHKFLLSLWRAIRDAHVCSTNYACPNLFCQPEFCLGILEAERSGRIKLSPKNEIQNEAFVVDANECTEVQSLILDEIKSSQKKEIQCQWIIEGKLKRNDEKFNFTLLNNIVDSNWRFLIPRKATLKNRLLNWFI